MLCKCSSANSVSINFGTSDFGKSSGKGFDGRLVNKVNFFFELLIIESRNVAKCRRPLQVVKSFWEQVVNKNNKLYSGRFFCDLYEVIGPEKNPPRASSK